MVQKTINDVKALTSILQILKYSSSVICEFIFEHEESFVDSFMGGSIIAITKLSFDGDHVHFVYVADGGSHISDYINIEEFTTWAIKAFKETL
jgi:hypothetical protein